MKGKPLIKDGDLKFFTYSDQLYTSKELKDEIEQESLSRASTQLLESELQHTVDVVDMIVKLESTRKFILASKGRSEDDLYPKMQQLFLLPEKDYKILKQLKIKHLVIFHFNIEVSLK